MNIYKFLLLLVLFYSTLLSNTIPLTLKEKNFIQKHPTIILGTGDSWEPYVIQNSDGSITGYDNDILTKINKLTGANFTLKPGNWVKIQKEAKNKQIDGLSTLIATDERKKLFNFSNIYISLKKMVMVKHRNPLNIHSASDLNGKTIVITKGNVADQKAADQFKNSKIIYADSPKEMLEMVIFGKADATFGNGATEYMLNNLGLPYMEDVFALDSSLDLRFAVRKDWPEAISILNKALATISKHERLVLQEKWFLGNSNNENNTKKQIEYLTPKEKKYLKNKKEITMCIDPNWMPFEKFENGKHIGMSADYFKIFEKGVGIPIKPIITKSWSQSLEFAKTRKCDILSLAMQTPKRKKYLNFTKPYLKIPLIIATKIDVPFIDNIAAIKGQKVGITKGYAFVEILKSKYPKLNIIEVNSIDEGLDRVNKGELFGYIGTLATIGYKFQKQYTGELKITGKFADNWELGIGVRNDDDTLLNILNKVVKHLDSKEKQKILNDWISIKYEKGVDYTLIRDILIVVFIVILLFLYKQYLLKKSNQKLQIIVNNKTKELQELNKNLEKKVIQRTSQLNDSYNEIRHILDSTLESIFIVENDLCIDMNQEAINLFGYPDKNSMMGKKAVDFTADSSIEIVLKNRQNNYTKPYEINMKKYDGTIFPALVRGSDFKKDDKLLRISSVLDLTELKAKESLLSQQSKLAAMGEMIGNIAHQWRQPLSVISTASSGMQFQKKYGMLTDEILDNSCEAINNNAQYLSKTIDDFKNFIKGERVKEFFYLEDSINSFLQLVEGTIKSKYLDVILDLEKDLTIDGYKNELIQCFINIFNNAKDVLLEKDEDDRFIFISTKKDSEDNLTSITFRDSGDGVPSDIITKVFDPYFTTKHQSQGTGLGLNMSYRIITEGMNGTIEVRNARYIYNDKEYNGAEFKISLPSHK